MSFFDRLKAGLSKTRRGLVDNVLHAVTGKARLDATLAEELEAALIGADLGYELTAGFIDHLRHRLELGKASSRQAVLDTMKDYLLEHLEAGPGSNGRSRSDFFVHPARPFVLMMVGVNGVGKTTTIAKLARQFRQRNKSVLVAAADTFRAAAAEQLEIWAQRAGVEIVRTQAGADPSAVIFDALKAAESRKLDVVIIDTAGRLHTKGNLMEELKKMVRVAGRIVPEAPHEVLLVLDASTGQNGLRQAEAFFKDAGVTGLVVTKLDGTAKGGIIFSIQERLQLPVLFVGVGEGMEDLQEFNPREFVTALFD